MGYISMCRCEGYGFQGVCLLVEGRGSRVTSRGSRVNGRGSRVTSRGSRVNGGGSKNPPQSFLNFFSI